MFSTLPARALRGRPPGLRANAVVGLFGLLVIAGLLGLMLILLPGDLVTDWRVRGTALELRDGSVSDSDCTGHDLIEICTLTVAAPVGTATVRRRLHYAFLSGQDDVTYTVRVVADPAHPQWLTTDLGLEAFWNRVASLAAGTVVFAGLLAGGAVGVWRSHRRWRAWRSADAVPVTLRLVARQRQRNGEFWTVRSEDGQTARWAVPRRSAPFVLDGADEVLGLQQTGSSAIMPLDARLRWVDLSRAERAASLAPGSR